MYDGSGDGIILQDAMSPEATTTIDWDAVLRDFAWAHALSDEEEHGREMLLQDDMKSFIMQCSSSEVKAYDYSRPDNFK
ncbi:hypothetical protein IAD21_02570 [Abditibacteriota bacterium]|nr:hypothetical protein IAD21_02570 [Abditibacteriota bacterium]